MQATDRGGDGEQFHLKLQKSLWVSFLPTITNEIMKTHSVDMDHRGIKTTGRQMINMQKKHVKPTCRDLCMHKGIRKKTGVSLFSSDV